MLLKGLVKTRKIISKEMSDINSDNRKVVIELQNVFRDFHVGDETVHALRGVSLKYMKENSLP